MHTHPQYSRHRGLWVLTHLGQKRPISVKQKPNDSAINAHTISTRTASTTTAKYPKFDLIKIPRCNFYDVRGRKNQ